MRQQWLPNPGESLYGLGQRQDGLLDIRGHDLDLKQYNTQIAVPFLVSSAADKAGGILVHAGGGCRRELWGAALDVQIE